MIQLLKRISLSFLLFTVSDACISQVKELTDDQYFKGNFKGLIQPLPVGIRWVDDSHFLLTRDAKTYLVDAKSNTEREATDADKAMPVIQPKPMPVVKNGDIFIKINNAEVQLTSDKDLEKNPTLSPDGNYVAYTKNNNLYTVNIQTKKENQLTTDGTELIMNGYSSWVYMEEILGRATQYKAFWWSPDSKRLAYFRSDDTNVPEFIITDGNGQHGLIEKTRYPKVGDPNPAVKIGIVSADGGNTVWADFNEKDDQYFGKPVWKADASALFVQWLNRKQDQLKIYTINLATGAKTPFYSEQQKTWVDLENDRMNFLQNGKGLLMMSDQTGWNHIYYYDNNGKLLNAVTSGKFTVMDMTYVDEAKGIVYFTAKGKENTARKDYYRVNLNGKNLQRLTFGEYHHNTISPSPNGSYFITTYSNSSTPTRSTLVSNTGKIIRELGDTKGPELGNYAVAKTELIRVKSDDGLYDLPMKVTWPMKMDKNKKYPVLISIYGGPNSTGVMDNWSLNGNQQFWAKEGLIQVSMDHRASGHFGKEGVNYMYHNLGYWEIKDYTSMVKWLIANGNADPSKIAITGFSYGGYMSAYALTYGADVFTHGMAGGTVADWSLYDSHYTERYMGTQADNAEGYKTSSVLTYADKYKGMLQIAHGVIDDNVHMQNSLQLISKLQDLKKEFEFMAYPGGRHGWGGNKGTHFQNLKTRFIYRYLLEKPAPKEMIR